MRLEQFQRLEDLGGRALLVVLAAAYGRIRAEALPSGRHNPITAKRWVCRQV
jgi:hypothetical protein